MSVEIATSYGPARVTLDGTPGASLLLALTHGAGGGVDALDLLAVRDAAVGIGAAVARIEQPYRVAGGRAPASQKRQDGAWVEVIGALRARYPIATLVQGGHSNGARVACRTARAVGAAAVIALAFPLHPPRDPEASRVAELRDAGVDVLVVNGDRDRFGVPAPQDAASVVVMKGEGHDLSKDPAAVAAVVMRWLQDSLGT